MMGRMGLDEGRLKRGMGKSNQKGLKTKREAVYPDLACGCLIAYPGAARGVPACSEPAASVHQGMQEIKTSFKVLNPPEMTH